MPTNHLVTAGVTLMHAVAGSKVLVKTVSLSRLSAFLQSPPDKPNSDKAVRQSTAEDPFIYRSEMEDPLFS
ncbi:hypothetical protein [Collimonas sp.]|jgi:hypothetical protein|uniref:hypothetical protein n=1 Tax=Collimonas sp. TaxID=1963772 RepID=UPI0037BF9106